MNIVKIGVVGVGNMGSYHCNKLKGMKNVDFIGVFDTDIAKANVVAQKLCVKAFDTYQELLLNIDAVIIAAPTKYHFSLVEEAISSQKHILVEKPIAVSLEETSKIKQLRKNQNLVLQVGHIERFNPVVGQLRKMANEDQIIFMEAKRLGMSGRIKDVDVVLDVMIHDIDIVLSFVKSPITNISAAGVCLNSKGHYDYVTAILSFQNGVIASLAASYISHEKERTFTITEKERMIKTDYLSKQQMVIKNMAAQPIQKSEYPTEFIIEKIAIPIVDPLTQEIEYFVKCIQQNQKPEVGLEEGEAALDVALRIKNCLQ